jgi:two-component system, chemotaxis family, chemotaxis protein CheY
VNADSATNAGTVLLLLGVYGSQTADQLTKESGLSPAGAMRQLHRLTEFGIIIVGSPDATGPSIYQLNPKGIRTETPDPRQRILLVDDTAAVRDVVNLTLEDAGYAVLATALPVNAVVLLNEIDFDLVITDSYSSSPSGTFASTAAVLDAARATPVALFSAHRIDPTDAQAAGFRDVIAKPFDVDVLEQQVRRLLSA